MLALNSVSYKTGRGRVLASREDRDKGVQLGKERHIYLVFVPVSKHVLAW